MARFASTDLPRLSSELAQALTFHDGPIHLDGLTSVESPEALMFAAQNGFDFSHLNELNLAIAKSIVEMVAGRGLTLGVLRLTSECARELAAHERTLTFEELDCLPDDVAAELNDHHGALNLEGVESLFLAAAESLGSHRGSLSLYLYDFELGDDVARALATHDGPLTLRVSQLSESAARNLAALRSPLRLEWIEIESPAVARALADHEGELLLGSSEISEEVAVELACHRGPLVLQATTILENAALALSQRQGDVSLRNADVSGGAALALLQSKSYVALPFAIERR